MCGICGELRFDRDSTLDTADLRLMADAIRHRGPDEEGLYSHAGVALANRRLSIIDLAGGTQPIWNEDHTRCIVYNGELYNFQDLRPELEAAGHIFRTKSDTEVILHAYEQWGAKSLDRFNGMFAYAIWDGPSETLFIARDRIGEKPLYYYQSSDRIVFGSEIKAILANRSVPRELNLNGVSNFLAYGRAVAPETIYKNIRKLLPGHYLTVRGTNVQLTRYWDINEAPDVDCRTEDEFAERLLSLLDDSVRRRMIADVPLGAFLSGGVDSSAVVALMKRHATAPVKTFSLGFTVGGAYNELSDARKVATALGTDHHELLVEHVDLVKEMRTLVYHYDEPFNDAASFPLFLLSRFARTHVKVALSGDGGDELFGGYRRYAVDRFAPYYQRLPRQIIEKLVPRAVDLMPRLRRSKRAIRTLPIADPARRYAAWLVLFTPEMQAELLQPQIAQAVAGHDPAWPYPHYYHELNGHTASDHLNRLMYVDFKTMLADTYMEKTDKASMACSLEARVPLLDHRLAELAFRIPSSMKIRGSVMKYILKRAVRDSIPEFVLQKPKHGFAVPTDVWFRGSLREFAFDILLDQRTARRGLFNMAYVERMWKEHVEGRHVWNSHLWALLNFETWSRIYLDGDAV